LKFKKIKIKIKDALHSVDSAEYHRAAVVVAFLSELTAQLRHEGEVAAFGKCDEIRNGSDCRAVWSVSQECEEPYHLDIRLCICNLVSVFRSVFFFLS
jgi:hypothetical protein